MGAEIAVFLKSSCLDAIFFEQGLNLIELAFWSMLDLKLKVGFSSSSSLMVSCSVRTAETEKEEKDELGSLRFGDSSEMGSFFKGWMRLKVEDLDLPAWLNIEQVWTHVLRFKELIFLPKIVTFFFLSLYQENI